MQTPPQNIEDNKWARAAQTIFSLFVALILYGICWLWLAYYLLPHVDAVLFPEPRRYSQPAPLGIMVIAWAVRILFPAVMGTAAALLLRRKLPFVSRGLWIGTAAAVAFDIFYTLLLRDSGW